MSADAPLESVRLVLELDLAGDGPSGRLVDEQGSSSAFFGWLQLMDGLEDVRRRAAGAAQPSPGPESDETGGHIDDAA
jgi:hypothetical protein